jgi:hypothetical protein
MVSSTRFRECAVSYDFWSDEFGRVLFFGVSKSLGLGERGEVVNRTDDCLPDSGTYIDTVGELAWERALRAQSIIS